MRMNTQKRIFKGVILSLALCAVVISVLPPVVFAATSTEYICTVLGNVNVRSGPGLSYEVVTTYSSGKTFPAVVEDYIEADGYRWYLCPDGYVAQTGRLKFDYYSVWTDTFTFVSPYGAEDTHTCFGDGTAGWGLELTVVDGGYWIHCDCGFSQGRFWPREQYHDSQGNLVSDIYFQGLDTDNDERVDLYPGQSKRLTNRSGSSLRPYRILEFFDDAAKDVPTVTLVFVDKDRIELARYTFAFSVDVRVYDYGVEMIGNDGTYELYEYPFGYLVTDLTRGFPLADRGWRYQVDYTIKDFFGNPSEKHPEYGFMVADVGDGPNGHLEKIIAGLWGMGEGLEEFITDFGGLNDVFTNDNSPVMQFANGIGPGVAKVFNLVRQFINCLPQEITTPIFVMFVLAIVLGILRLFL